LFERAERAGDGAIGATCGRRRGFSIPTGTARQRGTRRVGAKSRSRAAPKRLRST